LAERSRKRRVSGWMFVINGSPPVHPVGLEPTTN